MRQDVVRKAEERVERRIELLTHLITYVVVNLAIFIIWFIFIKGFPWFLLILIPWGVGLLAHFIGVLVFDKIREKMIDREIKHETERRDGERSSS